MRTVREESRSTSEMVAFHVDKIQKHLGCRGVVAIVLIDADDHVSLIPNPNAPHAAVEILSEMDFKATLRLVEEMLP